MRLIRFLSGTMSSPNLSALEVALLGADVLDALSLLSSGPPHGDRMASEAMVWGSLATASWAPPPHVAQMRKLSQCQAPLPTTAATPCPRSPPRLSLRLQAGCQGWRLWTLTSRPLPALQTVALRWQGTHQWRRPWRRQQARPSAAATPMLLRRSHPDPCRVLRRRAAGAGQQHGPWHDRLPVHQLAGHSRTWPLTWQRKMVGQIPLQVVACRIRSPASLQPRGLRWALSGASRCRRHAAYR
mmetsp:Transcript_70448/g.153027  ORF Transcript_70448/g.153027 Transcript_70448/m.153027 type:complete len:242 (-) Transcript_70448:613-1338(-)